MKRPNSTENGPTPPTTVRNFCGATNRRLHPFSPARAAVGPIVLTTERKVARRFHPRLPGIPPPVEWQAGPPGTGSYALVLGHEAPGKLASSWRLHWIRAPGFLVPTVHPPTSLLPAAVAVVVGAAAVWTASAPSQPPSRVVAAARSDVAGPGATALGRAWGAYLAGDLPTAVEAYRAAAEAERRAVTPLLGIMVCEAARGDAAASLAAARAALERDPANPQARRHLAIAAYDRGEFAAAEAECREMLALHPEDVEATALLGWCLVRQARPGEARACFEAVLAAAPGHPSAGAGLATLEAAPGRRHGAVP